MDNRSSSFLEDISVPSYELRQGMFVSNLDCGWEKTPFLIEGVLLKKQEEIDLIKSIARYVTVDLVRSEDSALQDYLRGEFYRRSQLGDAEANTFAASHALNSEDIQPLTFDPSDAPLDAAQKIDSRSFASRLKRMRLCLCRLRSAKDMESPRSEFPKALRPSYLPVEIGLVSHSPTEFSWPALRLAQQTVKETIATLAEVTRTIERYRTIDSRQIVRAAETLAENMIHFPEAMIWASRLRKKTTVF
jgi:hypothetical protein